MTQEDYKKLFVSYIPKKTNIQKLELLREDINSLKKKYEINFLDFESDIKWVNSYGKFNKGFIFYCDSDYPEILKNFDYSPFRIAWEGKKLPLGSINIGVVGTRRADGAGREAAFLFGFNASLNGANVFSGFSEGVDICATYGATEACRPSYTIFPCGLSHQYAQRHRDLKEQIVRNGGGFYSLSPAVSEPYKWMFYRRNYLLASLCSHIVAVEAGLKSGTSITTSYALDISKEVCILNPGKENLPWCLGTRELFLQGCKSFANWNEFRTYYKFSIENEAKYELVPLSSQIDIKELSFQKAKPFYFDGRMFVIKNK